MYFTFSFGKLDIHLLSRFSQLNKFFFEEAYSGNKKKSKKILDPLINNDKTLLSERILPSLEQTYK